MDSTGAKNRKSSKRLFFSSLLIIPPNKSEAWLLLLLVLTGLILLGGLGISAQRVAESTSTRGGEGEKGSGLDWEVWHKVMSFEFNEMLQRVRNKQQEESLLMEMKQAEENEKKIIKKKSKSSAPLPQLERGISIGFACLDTKETSDDDNSTDVTSQSIPILSQASHFEYKLPSIHKGESSNDFLTINIQRDDCHSSNPYCTREITLWYNSSITGREGDLVLPLSLTTQHIPIATVRIGYSSSSSSKQYRQYFTGMPQSSLGYGPFTDCYETNAAQIFRFFPQQDAEQTKNQSSLYNNPQRLQQLQWDFFNSTPFRSFWKDNHPHPHRDEKSKGNNNQNNHESLNLSPLSKPHKIFFTMNATVNGDSSTAKTITAPLFCTNHDSSISSQVLWFQIMERSTGFPQKSTKQNSANGISQSLSFAFVFAFLVLSISLNLLL